MGHLLRHGIQEDQSLLRGAKPRIQHCLCTKFRQPGILRQGDQLPHLRPNGFVIGAAGIQQPARSIAQIRRRGIIHGSAVDQRPQCIGVNAEQQPILCRWIHPGIGRVQQRLRLIVFRRQPWTVRRAVQQRRYVFKVKAGFS